MLSVVGKGGCGGGGGTVRFGHPHGAVTRGEVWVCGVPDMMAEVSTASMKASPMVGNLSDIMPKSTQAPLLRKKVFVQSVMYVICLVENIWPFTSEPDRLSRVAPNNLIPSLLAERIFVLTGMRLEVVRPSLWRRLVPAKQLWHPVSARAVIVVELVLLDDPSDAPTKSAWRGVADSMMVGWGFDLPFFHVCVRLSKRWWSTVRLMGDCHCPWVLKVRCCTAPIKTSGSDE